MLTASKYYLGFIALILFVYGLLCAIKPELLTQFAGITIDNWVAKAELRTLYGGAQITIALFSLIGIIYPSYLKPAVLLNTLLFGCIALIRAIALFVDGDGMGFSGLSGIERYNAQAFWFIELPLCLTGGFLLMHLKRLQTAQIS